MKIAPALTGLLVVAIGLADARIEKRVTQVSAHKLERRSIIDNLVHKLAEGATPDLAGALSAASAALQHQIGAQGGNALFTPITNLFQKSNHVGATPEGSKQMHTMSTGDDDQPPPADAVIPSGKPPPGASDADFLTNSNMLVKAPSLRTTGPYADAIVKAQALVKQLTLEEKVKMVTGSGWQAHPCVGGIDPIPRVNFPGLCLQDGPQGVRYADRITAFPPGITTAATFSKKLIHDRGVAIAQEFKTKGANVYLGPGMNMMRAPASGRAFEYAGGDPYVAGEVAFQTIKGVQSQGVQATAKHFLGNDQEHFRNFYSVNMDARTTREIYGHPFLRAVQAGTASVMCSYNQINSTWACQNDALINGYLKTELGFQGWVVSDWGAQHSGVLTAQTIDMAQPGDRLCCFQGQKESDRFWGPNLVTAVKNGSVTQDRVDDMVTRVLAGWYMTGQDDGKYPKVNFDSFSKVSAINQHIDATADHAGIAREVAAAGIVLVKNTEGALPLTENVNSIALIGNNAGPAFNGANYFSDRGGIDGHIATGWGSGSVDFSYLISPYEAIQARARQDRIAVSWTFNDFDLDNAKAVGTPVDKALVFVGALSGEEYITVDGNQGDRNNLTAWHNGDALVQAVAAVQSNTIVVVSGPGPVDVEAWIDHPNVTAVLFAHYGGSESGNAIADVLFGDVNPSGRLPYTLAKKRADYSADVLYRAKSTYVALPYTEGLLVDYRWFDAKGIEPRFPFGYGLSYTSFKYSGASGSWVQECADAKTLNARWGANETASQGMPDWLFEDAYKVRFQLANTGTSDGFEVPQVYLGFPASAGEPPKVLRAFDRVAVKAGGEVEVEFTLSAYDLTTYDPVSARWLMPEGDITVFVGASSRDIRQTLTL